MLYEIQPTGPARRLATQKVGYDQQGKSTAAAQIAATLSIISQFNKKNGLFQKFVTDVRSVRRHWAMVPLRPNKSVLVIGKILIRVAVGLRLGVSLCTPSLASVVRYS